MTDGPPFRGLLPTFKASQLEVHNRNDAYGLYSVRCRQWFMFIRVEEQVARDIVSTLTALEMIE